MTVLCLNISILNMRGVIASVPMLLGITATVKFFIWSLALSALLSITNSELIVLQLTEVCFFPLRPQTMCLCYGCAADLSRAL